MRNLLNKIRSFGADKSGAVTVDWVALTAAVVVIGIALVYAVFGADNETGFSGVANSIADQAELVDTFTESNVNANAPAIVTGGGS